MVTWNVQGSKHTDVAALAEVIDSESPDVVVVQEIRDPQARELAELLSMTHCWAMKHNPFLPFFSSRAEGASILTPHTMSASDHVRVSTASSKRSYQRRIVQWATIARDDASGYRVYNTHLSPNDLAAERLEEAERIAEIARRHGDAPPAIVAGDLNDANEPGIIAALPGIEVLAAPPTNPSESPSQALDHVLVPPDARDVSVSVPAGGATWADLSDHLPLTKRFTLDWVEGDFAL